jgi:hypothetical protein
VDPELTAATTVGRTLASGSDDQTVRLWEMNIDQAIQQICPTTEKHLHSGEVGAVRLAGSTLPPPVPVMVPQV